MEGPLRTFKFSAVTTATPLKRSTLAAYTGKEANRTNTIHIFNKNYATTTIANGTTIFSIRTITGDTLDTPMVSVVKGQSTVNDYYDITMPSTTDYLQIYIRADVGEKVQFYIEKLDYATITATLALNTNMALMNKNVKQIGGGKSFFVAPYGSSYITAKEAVKMAMAIMSEPILATAWSKLEHNFVVLGTNQRAINVKSGYKNPDENSEVSALSDYQIIGGKTGENASGSIVKLNLVIAVKSKVDDAILIGAILYAQSETAQSNRFTMMRDMFDALELKRQGQTVDISSLNCNSAYAIVCPSTNLGLNYTNDFDIISVSKNSNLRVNSHSLAKMGTALLVSKYLKQYDKLIFDTNDLYSGQSGTKFNVGDIAFVSDLVTTLFLTSSSEATIKLAHQVGIEYCKNNLPMISFCIDLIPAYISNYENTMTFYDWISTADADEWALDSGKTITCASSSSAVLIDNEPLYLNGNAILGSTNIEANADYIVVN